MRLKRWWGKQSLFIRYFLFVFAILTFVIGGVEVYIEAWVARLLGFSEGDMHGWHEAVLWGVSILIPSLAAGYLLARALSRRLGKIAKMSQSLAGGNLEARLPVLESSADDFNQLMRSLNNMADSLAHLLHNERRLLLDISHELRSPLTRMNISAALLQRSQSLEESTALGARMEKEVEYMSLLVERLLSQGKATMSDKDVTKPIVMEHLLASLVDDFSLQAEAQGKKIQADIPKNITVYGRHTSLKGMLGNVLSNALFYTPPHGKVLLRAKSMEEDLVISIRDFGPGVPENHLEDIFRPFYRLDESRSRDSGGAGLGLALAKESVLHHGGSISAKSAHPGLEVTINLPLYQEGDLGEE